LATLFEAAFRAACPAIKSPVLNPTSGETLVKMCLFSFCLLFLVLLKFYYVLCTKKKVILCALKNYLLSASFIIYYYI
jgi:hypothetical protein